MKIDTVTQNRSTVQKCKAIRDRVYDPEEFGYNMLLNELKGLMAKGPSIADLGCGRDAKFLRALPLENHHTAYGVDLEVVQNSVEGNIHMIRGDAGDIPLDSCTLDVVTMRDVIEHLRNPGQVFLECRRVLKPGGSLLVLGPCKYYPPIMLGRMFPHKIRQTINALVTRTRTRDTFPAYYKANSARELRRLAKQAEFEMMDFHYALFHPLYYMFSTAVYRCAVVTERAILRRQAVEFMRHQVFCHLRKPSS